MKSQKFFVALQKIFGRRHLFRLFAFSDKPMKKIHIDNASFSNYFTIPKIIFNLYKIF